MTKDPPRERPAEPTHRNSESSHSRGGDSHLFRSGSTLFSMPELSQRPSGESAHMAGRWQSSLSAHTDVPGGKVGRNGIEFYETVHSIQDRILGALVPDYDRSHNRRGHS